MPFAHSAIDSLGAKRCTPDKKGAACSKLWKKEALLQEVVTYIDRAMTGAVFVIPRGWQGLGECLDRFILHFILGVDSDEQHKHRPGIRTNTQGFRLISD